MDSSMHPLTLLWRSGGEKGPRCSGAGNLGVLLESDRCVEDSSVLAWRVPGTGEPGGLLSLGSHRVRLEVLITWI